MKFATWLFSLLTIFAVQAFAEPPMIEPGFQQTQFLSDHPHAPHLGLVSMWNTPQKFIMNVETSGGWRMKNLYLFIHHDLGEVPLKNKKLNVDGFHFKQNHEGNPVEFANFTFDLQDDLEFNWGYPWEDERVKYIVLRADLALYNDKDNKTALAEAYTYGPVAVPGAKTATAFPFLLTHPRTGHFRDSPVAGIWVRSKTFDGRTDGSGKFNYFPDETATFSVGNVLFGETRLSKRITPLDFFDGADTSDKRVINMARLLQSLDADGEPQGGISITPEVEVCLESAVGDQELDFTDDGFIEGVISETISLCAGIEGLSLASVSAEDARINLEDSLNSNMFRKNISRTPELTSSKSKLNIMGVWFPALKANGEPAMFHDGEIEVDGIPYYDEDGNLIRVADEAKPIVLAYTDGVEETGYEDIFSAVSRDDGNTFKRKNLSRAADRSSFTLENGNEYYGQAKKPVFHVKGNNILISWTSKFCKGGKPTYAITTCDDPETEVVETPDPVTDLCRITCTGDGENQVCEPDYPYDDPYFEEDIWGVGGPQLSVDYAEQDYPEVGEVPYSCVWTARGTIVNQGMINKGGFWAEKVVGDIVWFKPERLTSGRRDANQVFMGGADGAGFAIAWQEDPEGLRPGDAAGPGPGWGGATTNHKTDIWYSYITMADFRKVDMNFVSGGDPEHELDVAGRPKALVPMSLPVRLSDNDAVNTDNLMVELDGEGFPVADGDGNWIPITNTESDGEGSGTHAYGYMVDGLCDDFYSFTNYQDVVKHVCITEDGRLLDGDTGASRPNLFLQTYTKTLPDGTKVKSAWAIMAYEETKGSGMGPPDHEEGSGPYGDEPVPEEGKSAIYHSFDFQKPDKVAAGKIINLPERDADGNLVYLREVSLDGDGNVFYGELILDYLGQPILAYENARRPRFILQGKSAMGSSSTPLLVLYKEGVEGHGRPSDIMLRRFEAPAKGNPYAPGNMVCNAFEVAVNGLEVCVDGVKNMSTVYPTVTGDPQGTPTSDDPYGAVKVIEWVQTPELFNDPSWENPYEDARAHRGQIRGDLVIMGYSYTPNWAASRNGNDKYDFYVRRSFDGGQTWTTDSAGDGVTHCQTWTYPDADALDGEKKVEECNTYPAGEFEQAHNLSQLKNSKSSVIEPRIVCPPGSIKIDGVWTGIPEDKQNKNVCYVAFGTSTNPKKDPDTGEQEAPVPEDLSYSFTQDRGESFVEVSWDVNPDSDGNYAGETVTRWDWMAKGDPEQGEVQLRMTPNGERFYASWLEEGEEGSDIMLRRIMPPEFPANVAQ